MAKFSVLGTSSSPQRIEADSVHYDEDTNLWVFRDSDKKPVAWIPREFAQVVAESAVIDKP